MALTTVWFILIATLWTGYLVLEGFDFGVGMLLRVLGRTDTERRVLINTIGPVWDGNEVWLLVAGGATFAAFPDWYATLFSGFYLPLLVILLALIVRGVGFEFRGKRTDAGWTNRWDWAITICSAVPALLWGVALADIVHGVPIDRTGEVTGGLLALVHPYALLGGLVTLSVFLTHGAVFLALKTHGELRDRANALALRLGLLAAVLASAFLVWTQVHRFSGPGTLCSIVAAGSLLAGLLAARRQRDGWAFVGTAVAITATTVALFWTLFPDVMPSTTSAAFSLTTTNASSTHYSLEIMTVVAIVFTPLVLLYQAWTYWVFRRRLSVDDIPQAAPMADEVAV